MTSAQPTAPCDERRNDRGRPLDRGRGSTSVFADSGYPAPASGAVAARIEGFPACRSESWPRCAGSRSSRRRPARRCACGSSTPSQPASRPATARARAVAPGQQPRAGLDQPDGEPPSRHRRPVPTPGPRPGAPRRPAGHPGRRPPPSDRGDDRRPRRRPGRSPGFSSASIVWQAPAEGGIPRYMMVFGENQPTDVGPVRSSRYYYIAWAPSGRRSTSTPVARPQALTDAARPRATASSSTTPTSSAWAGLLPPHQQSASRRTTCTPTGKQLDALAKRLRRQGRRLPADLAVRAGRPARAAPGRRQDHVRLPDEHDPLRLRPHDEHLPADGQRRGQAEGRRDQEAGRPEERGRDAHALRPAQRRPSRRSTGSRRTSSAAASPGSRRTARRSRAPGARSR